MKVPEVLGLFEALLTVLVRIVVHKDKISILSYVSQQKICLPNLLKNSKSYVTKKPVVSRVIFFLQNMKNQKSGEICREHG
jgi:hypothetical protein